MSNPPSIQPPPSAGEHIPVQRPPRGLMFWALASCLLLFLTAMPLLVLLLGKRDAASIVTMTGVELAALMVLIGFFDPVRFWWAWRAVGALVFLAYSAYLANMLIKSGGNIAITPRRSEASAFNALCGLVVFGIPGLLYALFGRLTPRREEEHYDAEHEWDDD